MAAKLRKVARREVVTLTEGRRLGRPVDILVDADEHRVAYVVLATGEAPETSVVVRAEDVQSFTADTLPVQSLDVLAIAARDPNAVRLLTTGIRLRGQPVLSTAGRRLGRITSVRVDERGTVTQYRVRKGILGYLRPALRIEPGDLRTSGGEMAVVDRASSPSPPPPDEERSGPAS